MPRQRTHHSRINYKFPDDFPQRLERSREASGMTWAELSRRLGAASLGLEHLLTPGRQTSRLRPSKLPTRAG